MRVLTYGKTWILNKVFDKINNAVRVVVLNLDEQVNQDTIVLAQALNRSSNGNTQSILLDVSEYKEALIFLEVTAAAGTNPTLDVVVQTQNPGTENWYTIETFTQKIAAGTEKKSITNFGKNIAISWVIGGTNSPNFTFEVDGLFKS